MALRYSSLNWKMDHRSIHRWNSGVEKDIDSPIHPKDLANPPVCVHGVGRKAKTCGSERRSRQHESNPQNEYWTDQCNYDKRKALHRSLGVTRCSTKIGNFHRFEQKNGAENEAHHTFSSWSTFRTSTAARAMKGRRTWMLKTERRARDPNTRR